MTKPELIIFDCDGVLIDSEAIANQALVDTLADYGVSMTWADAIKRYVGLSDASMIGDIEERYHVTITEDFWNKERLWREKLFEQKLKAIPGILELINKITVKKCVASSSSPDRLRHTLGLVKLWDFFAPNIFSATQVKNGKPAPDLFLFAADQMKTHPSACLVIEDSIAGVRAAKAANMRVFGFTGGSHCDATHGERLLNEGAEKVFNHMDQIAEALLQSVSP